MNKRISTLFAASLLFSSVFGGSAWAEELNLASSPETKIENGGTYFLVFGNRAYGFDHVSLQDNEIIDGLADPGENLKYGTEDVPVQAYLWKVGVTSQFGKYTYTFTNALTGDVLRYGKDGEIVLKKDVSADETSTEFSFGTTQEEYDNSKTQYLYPAKGNKALALAYSEEAPNYDELSLGSGVAIHFYKAADETITDSDELNALYNSAGFNLKLDDKYEDVENIFDDSRIKAIQVTGSGVKVGTDAGYSFPAGTYFAVSTPAGSYEDAKTTADKLAYLMDCEFIVVSPTENISDDASEQKLGRGFTFTTATGRELNKYTETDKDKIDPSKQATGSEISVYNACFEVKKTASSSGKYSIGLETFRYEASAGTYAERGDLILNIAEKKYGSNTYLTTQTGTTAYIFTFVESNAEKGTAFLKADGPSIYNIQFVSGTDDDTDELNKYLYAPAYATKLYAKGAALTDTNMPEFQFIVTEVSGNNVTFTNRANSNVKFTAKLFTEENGAYSLAIASSSSLKKFDVLNITEEGDVDDPTQNADLNLKWVKLTTPESTDKFNGTWNVADESKVTISFARDNTPTSNKLYPTVKNGSLNTPTNDVSEAAQWQLVKVSEKPTYKTSSYAYLVGEGGDAEVKYMSLGDTIAYYSYNFQLIEDGEAVAAYLDGTSAKLSTTPTTKGYVIKDNVDGSVSIVVDGYNEDNTLAFKEWDTTNDGSDLDKFIKNSNKSFAEVGLEEFETPAATYIKTYLLSEAPEVSWPGEEGHVSIQSELGNYISMNENRDGIVVNTEEEVYYLNVTDKDAVVPSFYISKGVGTADRMFLFNPADSVNYYVAAGQFDREYEWAKDMTKAIFKAGQLNETADTLTTEIKGKVAKVAMKADNAGTQAGLKYFKYQIVEAEDGDSYYYIRQNGKYLANWSDKLTWESQDKATLFQLESVAAPTANEAISATDVKVIALDGAVNVKNAAGKNVVVSTILGQIVANEVLTSDNATISVPAGIAIVSVDGEEAVKVSVK